MSVQHLEVLVEEESMAVALESLLPKVVGVCSFNVYRHRGKRDLLKKLPQRLTGYSTWLRDDWRILVVVDRDQDDCHVLKRQLDSYARQAGLSTRTYRSLTGAYQVVNRIAVEELEAWYFGDWEAMRTCYDRLPPTVPRNARYRNPDAIPDTWETLERIFQKAGYFKGGLLKVELARTVSPYMDPGRNRSDSFQIFRDAMWELVSE